MRQSCIDTPEIGTRAKEIRDAEMKVLAGCTCPAGTDGNVNHRDGCALWPGLPPATPPVPHGVSGWWRLATWAESLADHRAAVADHIEKRDKPGCNQAIAQ